MEMLALPFFWLGAVWATFSSTLKCIEILNGHRSSILAGCVRSVEGSVDPLHEFRSDWIPVWTVACFAFFAFALLLAIFPYLYPTLRSLDPEATSPGASLPVGVEVVSWIIALLPALCCLGFLYSGLFHDIPAMRQATKQGAREGQAQNRE